MRSKSSSIRGLSIAGLLAIIGSVLVNIGISLFAKNTLHVPTTFLPLGIGPIIFWSTVCGIGAFTVFGALKRWSARPLSTYIIVSIVVYICTFIPDALLLSDNPMFPNVTAPAVLTLMSMHAAEAAIILCTLIFLELR